MYVIFFYESQYGEKMSNKPKKVLACLLGDFLDGT